MNPCVKTWLVAVHPAGPVTELTLGDLCEFNRARAGKGEPAGYWPLEVCGSLEEALEKGREWKKRRRDLRSEISDGEEGKRSEI